MAYGRGCCAAPRALLAHSFEFCSIFISTFRAEAVGEKGVGVLAEIDFQQVPETVIIPYLLTGCADRYQALQGFDL